MLAETKSRRCIRFRPPRRSHANPQSSAHLKQPCSCLAGAADTATRRAYGLPGEKTVPRARRTKASIPEPAEQLRDRPQLREDLGHIGGTQQPEGRRQPRSCSPSSRHLEGLRPARKGRSPQGQENKIGHAGSAGQPRDRSPSSGSLGPIGGILQPQGSRRPRSSSRRCRASDH